MIVRAAFGVLAYALLITGAQAYEWDLPRGFPVPHVPADNPMSEAKVALGRRLFCEPRLSITKQHSCASCHDAAKSFTDGRRVGVGATGSELELNSMALVNVAYNVSFGWQKPKVRSLEAQMLEPLLNEHPVELGLRGREDEVSAELSRDESYRTAFAAAFDGDGRVTFDRIIKAIAAFERTLISCRSPFDRYVFGGDHLALSESAKRGMALFFSERVNCARCHSGFNFSGNWRDAKGESGPPTLEINGTTEMPMRVPTLRNIALTAPYMHDGRFATLEAVLEHYNQVGNLHPEPVTLSPDERADLLAFLHSLTDEEFIARSVAESAPFCAKPETLTRRE